MEDVNSIQLVGQFLHERGFKLTLEALQEERLVLTIASLRCSCVQMWVYSSGRRYDPEKNKETGMLQSILGQVNSDNVWLPQ